jgi:hypothetical protein
MTKNTEITGSGRPMMAMWRASTVREGLRPGAFWLHVLVFAAIAILWQLGAHVYQGGDYVGADPDDSMRLVEIRDFLAGQGWFDLHQYRLGPDGGTLMHWSRLIDAPIAGLIVLLSQFVDPHQAEVLAVMIWPPLLVLPLMAAMGLAAYRLGGRSGLVVALILTVLLLAAIIRFRPGAIDHHNVQLVIVVTIAAMLIDPRARASNFAVAAIAAALGLAIGVETTPLIAIAALAVACLWAVVGQGYRMATIGFGLTFALATGLVFFGTTPASLYAEVTCDTLSVGYFALVAAGGLGLALAALLVSGRRMATRFASLAVIGAGTAILAIVVAPECLHNPLNDLDPLLVKMWLNGITEAQSIVAEMNADPKNIGGFYAVGLIALAVSAYRIQRRELILAHAILLALIGISWAVSAYQIRGGIFANFLAFIPLSALIAELRALYLERRNDARTAIAFALSALASLPTVWTVVGVLAFEAGEAAAGIPSKKNEDTTKPACPTKAALAPIAALPPGRILSTSNPGSVLLRHTPHAVLTANYHRNQAGMVAALRMAMAPPEEARAMMAAEKISYVLFCHDDGQLGTMRANFPNGLFARLDAGDIPDFLAAVPVEGNGELKVFRVVTP